MRTAKADDVRFATLAAIKREFFAHDFDRLGPSRFQVFRAINRVPKLSHVLAGECVRAGVIKIHEIDHLVLLEITYEYSPTWRADSSSCSLVTEARILSAALADSDAQKITKTATTMAFIRRLAGSSFCAGHDLIS